MDQQPAYDLQSWCSSENTTSTSRRCIIEWDSRVAQEMFNSLEIAGAASMQYVFPGLECLQFLKRRIKSQA